MVKLWRKLKWLVFFWDTVYNSALNITCTKLTNNSPTGQQYSTDVALLLGLQCVSEKTHQV